LSDVIKHRYYRRDAETLSEAEAFRVIKDFSVPLRLSGGKEVLKSV